MKTLFTFILSFTLFSSLLHSQVVVTSTDLFSTRDQMLLANEINESGEPFAEALGYNLDLLDPAVLDSPDSIAYTLGIENYEYSRYLLGTVVSRSGIGLHLMWGPVIKKMAAMMPDDFDGTYTDGMKNGVKEDDILMKNIMHFGMLANQTPPKNPFPQFAEFVSGDPHLSQAPASDFTMDFSSLRWDRSKMDKTLNLGAMGQALMKQYLWAQDMLGGFHDADDNGIDPDGTVSPDSTGSPNFDPDNNVFYGGSAIDGFIGQVLTAEAINKTVFLINALAYDGTQLGKVEPSTYNPEDGIKYFPHHIAITEGASGTMLPPKVTAMEVTDASSDIFDQLSYLWGTLNYKNMMDPDNNSDVTHFAYHDVFDGNPFPAPMAETGVAGPFDLMKGTSKVIFMNLMAMHFNKTEKTFVNTSGLSGGTVQQGTKISTVNAGYIVMVLSKMKEEFAGTPLEQKALDAVNAQSQFLMNSLKDADGGYFNSFTIGSGADNSPKTAETQAAAARGLYAAYTLTSNTDYLDAANEAYDYLIANFYVATENAFLTEAGNSMATYTPFNFAVITGGLREAALVGNKTEAPAIYTGFFKRVANKMQLAEFGPTGESGSDSDNDGIPYLAEQPNQLAPVFAAEAQLHFHITSAKKIDLNKFHVAIYPNPVKTNVTIDFELTKATNVKIDAIDYTGKTVETIVNRKVYKGEFKTLWSVNNLTAGIYFLRISAGDEGVTTKKIIVK